MSRIRIVGGTITKTTVGDHNIYSDGNIVYSAGKAITETSDVGIKYGDPKDAPIPKKREAADFDITFELDKKEKTVVPFGILDFENKEENQFFKFKLKVSGEGINQWQLNIKNEDGFIYTCYSATNELSEVVITSKTKKSGKSASVEEPKDKKSESFWPAGEYVIYWDGFDIDEIYDSTRFNGKKLQATITGIKNGKQKTSIVDFSANYSEVEWTDVKIDKKKKRIDVTLRVNLIDGGAQGLSCSTYTTEREESYETFTPTNSSDSLAGIEITTCDWDKVPTSETKKWGKSPIITRTKSFQDLINLAISGLNYHWGRNKNHAEAKDIKIFGDSYSLFMNTTVSENKSIGGLKLIYNTNGNWARSGNPGTIKDPLSAAGNVISRQAICYNVGYIYSLDWYEFYKKNNWRYREEFNENIEFQETSAHEIGHEILKKYGGTIYSYGHKGTVNPVFQQENSNAIPYPTKGEIDLMPYYTDWLDYKERKRIAASEKDALSLIWLTKLVIK